MQLEIFVCVLFCFQGPVFDIDLLVFRVTYITGPTAARLFWTSPGNVLSFSEGLCVSYLYLCTLSLSRVFCLFSFYPFRFGLLKV